MKYGIHLPNFGPWGSASELAKLAKSAEDAGWDGLFIWDHVDRPQVFDGVDPWIAMAAMAISTSKIQLGALVTPIPRRRPWQLARQAVSIDHLSEGRLIFGFGIGSGRDEEWANFGEEADPKIRGKMLDEGLAILEGLWSGEEFSFQGDHYKITNSQFMPKPVQSPRIPLWGAGYWPNKAPFRRAARFDGIYPLFNSERFSELDQLREVVNFMAQERQTDKPFDIVFMGNWTHSKDWRNAGKLVEPYAEAGATWWVEEFTPRQFGIDWEEPWPFEEVKARIAEGPPKF
jgi:alkanesulfonate monooxygenase SsuD/methylene tetrahydromethanopterin reductase-like flavin-dependent oxidoreductase (luciferase family)